MARVLFLAHRLPYPPDKGDKIRAYHVLQHLQRHHEVLLGTFVDDPADLQHVSHVRGLCHELHVRRVHRRAGLLGSLAGLLTGEALSQRFYRDRSMHEWVRGVCHGQRADVMLVYSSPMAQYAANTLMPTLVDFCDLESAKWARYAATRRWPLSALYARESRCVQQVERKAAASANWSFFSTESELAQFRALAPEQAPRACVFGNGVDADYFAPDPARASPFAAAESVIVFTGTMDYWPNVDAVLWFAAAVLPELRQRYPTLRFCIVGRNPTAAVRALSSDAVQVTGEVPDVRPYLQHAAAVVVPVRLVHGIPNKLLEALAMERPVVASAGCVASVGAEAGRDVYAATTALDYVGHLDTVLSQPVASQLAASEGRRFVLAHHAWPSRLAVLDAQINAITQAPSFASTKPLPDTKKHLTGVP